MSGLREFARRLGVGKAARLVYHRPVGLVRQSILEGGPVEQWRTAGGRAAMIEAAERLPPLGEPPIGSAAEVAFLTGPKYWFQTVFCFVSLQLGVPFKITPVVFDDGAMTAALRDRLRRIVPWAEFVDRDATEARLDRLLPRHAFPALRARREVYPHLRKLTDMQLGPAPRRLILDSDMLFFRPPARLIEWFEAPHAVYMQDVATAYGYPLDFLSRLAGAPVPERVNVGLYALDAHPIDWERLEHWCAAQNEHYGPSYLQEQGLTAMLFAGRPAAALPRTDYVVMPGLDEGRAPAAVLHHYVAQSKRSYYQHGWQRVFERACAAAAASSFQGRPPGGRSEVQQVVG
ncbi:glycosyl transferase [Prosthecomicrobium pneumaticum]|uniref:Glycosyl transferase n=1 Tax=Prosthecomicrobium pneumaticum TaxID=81895 RepID=A0A7W9CUG4_9HYPH|nr:glycosyl transferase [Prosthecomicrobium pneumaticum]MBB5751879.1 hypothetical protein [Prosthecomicrobium pneumaticum]